jgi:hypothetical protein
MRPRCPLKEEALCCERMAHQQSKSNKMEGKKDAIKDSSPRQNTSRYLTFKNGIFLEPIILEVWIGIWI